MTKSFNAWVLHKHWSGDTSAKISFLTCETGLIECFCKGGRTPKKQALLQPFTPLWISVEERYERYYTNRIESISPTLHLEGISLFSGLYLNELLYYALSPGYSAVELFNAYLMTLKGLASTQDKSDVESLLRRFEWTLLKTCGYSFSFTEESQSRQAIDVDICYQFIAGEGFISASKGIPGEHLLAIAEDNLSHSDYLKSAKGIMRQAIDHLLGGREIKARLLFR